jgi:hypothetical protein
MLLFLNFDCVLSVPADAAGPQGRSDAGIRRLESVLHAWPALRVVITSDRRYHWTLEHFRSFLALEFQHRVVATTLLYDPRAPSASRTREDEILEWLDHGGPRTPAWWALDDRTQDYAAHAHRLLPCNTFTSLVLDTLHVRLLQATDASSVATLAPLIEGMNSVAVAATPKPSTTVQAAAH